MNEQMDEMDGLQHDAFADGWLADWSLTALLTQFRSHHAFADNVGWRKHKMIKRERLLTMTSDLQKMSAR